MFYVYIQKNKKQNPQYLHFRCRMTHLNHSMKKLGPTIKLQKELLKIERKHDEIDGNNYKDKKLNGLFMLNKKFCILLFLMLDSIKLWKKLLDSQGKTIYQHQERGWRYFNSMRDDSHEPIYTYNDKYMRYLRKTG